MVIIQGNTATVKFVKVTILSDISDKHLAFLSFIPDV